LRTQPFETPAACKPLPIDAVVNSASAAVKLLDELWEVNRPHILP